jgi:hypothetical protein
MKTCKDLLAILTALSLVTGGAIHNAGAQEAGATTL